MFNLADADWRWRIDFITLTIDPDDYHQISYWSFFNENPSPEDADINDNIWTKYIELLALDTTATLAAPRL